MLLSVPAVATFTMGSAMGGPVDVLGQACSYYSPILGRGRGGAQLAKYGEGEGQCGYCCYGGGGGTYGRLKEL